MTGNGSSVVAAAGQPAAALIHAPRESKPPADTLASCGPFHATRWCLVVTNAPTFAQWERAGQHFSEMREAAIWALADWLAYGEAHYGEDYAQALDAFNFSEGYLLNLHTLFRNFPPERRRWALGVSYYQAVLPLQREAQDTMLDLVLANQLTRDELRTEVRALPDGLRKRPRAARPAREAVQIVDIPAAEPAAAAPAARELSGDELCAYFGVPPLPDAPDANRVVAVAALPPLPRMSQTVCDPRLVQATYAVRRAASCLDELAKDLSDVVTVARLLALAQDEVHRAGALLTVMVEGE